LICQDRRAANRPVEHVLVDQGQIDRTAGSIEQLDSLRTSEHPLLQLIGGGRGGEESSRVLGSLQTARYQQRIPGLEDDRLRLDLLDPAGKPAEIWRMGYLLE